jgi:hypothetical protein
MSVERRSGIRSVPSSGFPEACIPSMGRDERGHFRASPVVTIKAINQIRPYVQPVKASATAKRKQVTA